MDKCETCVWYVYDEDYDDYICDMDLDEDESNKTHPQAALPGGMRACSAEKNTTHWVVFPVFCGALSGLALAAAQQRRGAGVAYQRRYRVGRQFHVHQRLSASRM